MEVEGHEDVAAAYVQDAIGEGWMRPALAVAARQRELGLLAGHIRPACYRTARNALSNPGSDRSMTSSSTAKEIRK